MRTRKRLRQQKLDAALLAEAARQARNAMPRMESRHVPTEWWVKP